MVRVGLLRVGGMSATPTRIAPITKEEGVSTEQLAQSVVEDFIVVMAVLRLTHGLSSRQGL